jgi:predicted Zn-dependent peptidase
MDRRILVGGLALASFAPACASHPPAAPGTAYASAIEHLRFANGMQAVLARTPPSSGEPRVFVGLYVRYGVAAEARPELAHLVEHIAANNTPLVQDYTVSDDIRVLGSNAMTRTDYSSLWRVVSPNGVDAFIGNRANRVAGLDNDTVVFAREVLRVSGELERAVAAEQQRGPSAGALLARTFRPEAPAAAERIRMVRSYTPADAFAEIDEFYRPGNSVLIIAGDVDLDAARASLQRRLGGYAAREGRSGAPAPAFPAHAGASVVRSTLVTETRVAVGLPAPPRRSRDFLAFLIADQLLLGGRADTATGQISRSDNAPLPRRLAASIGGHRFGDGISYDESPPPLAQVSPSYLTITFTTPNADALAIERAVSVALADIAETASDAEINAARGALVAFLSSWMLSPNLLAMADHLAAFALIDEDATRLNRLHAELEAVPPAAVRRLLAGFAEERAARLGLVLPAAN